MFCNTLVREDEVIYTPELDPPLPLPRFTELGAPINVYLLLIRSTLTVTAMVSIHSFLTEVANAKSFQ